MSARAAACATAGALGRAPVGNVKIQSARDAIPPLKEAHINFDRHDIRILRTKSGEPPARSFHPSIDDTLHRWTDARRELGLNGRQPLFRTLRGDVLIV